MVPFEPLNPERQQSTPARPRGERPSLHLPVADPGSSAASNPGLSDDSFQHLIRRHPCISDRAHNRVGRIHLPVSPSCNIQCRFCRRGFHKFDQRPGVARSLLSVADAVETVERAIEHCPEIGVVGIAGPGDGLATPHALEALRAVGERFPKLILCLSTNGLRLFERARELERIGLRVLTVTVNAISPNVLVKIVSSVRSDGVALRGMAAAEALIEAQRRGIRCANAAGIFVKVNTVVIPGINLHHVDAVAQACSEWGARQINLIPLIPQHEFAHHRAPSCAELARARELAQSYLPVFRHCRQCRADACGIPGKERDQGVGYGGIGSPREATFSHG